MDSVEGLEVALSADLLTMMINVDGWLCCLLSRCHEPIPSRVITVVALTAARGRESTLSTLSWHPVPRVAFACISSAALGNLEVTAPAVTARRKEPAGRRKLNLHEKGKKKN